MSAALRREAALENEERKADTCSTCNAPADEDYEPFCRHCGSYWQDVRGGLFEIEDE